MAAGTKQKGAKVTRVIGEEAVTVTGLELQRAASSGWTGSECFQFGHTSCIKLGAPGEVGGRA